MLSHLTKPVVLVVEDEPLILLMAQDMLDDAGFLGLPAINADEAVKHLQSRSDIRAVFTDVDMPGSMSGIALAKLVAEQWPGIPVVVTSGHIRVGRSALPHNSTFFPKPYDIDKVTDFLAQALRHPVSR